MKILFCLFFMVLNLDAQSIFSETFSSFLPDTTAANIDLVYPLDSLNYTPKWGDFSGNNADLSVLLTQTPPGMVQLSVLTENGYSQDFQGSGTLTLVNNGILNETGNKSIAVIFNADGVSGTQYIASHTDGSSNNDWGLYLSNTTLRWQVWGATNAYRPSSSKAIDTWYVVIGVYDSVGTASLTLYVNGIASAEAVVGTIPETLNGINERMNLSGVAGGGFDLNGQIDFFALYNTALTAKQAKEIGFLAAGWKSGGGAVTRSNFGFHQGISGSGLTVKTKAGGSGDGFTFTPTLTASSVTYTHREALPFEFNTDSLLIVTDTDSIWKAMPDTILATTDSMQITFDAHETGGVVYVDNISIGGYTIPTATTTGEFKGNSGYDKFKGW